MWCTPGLGYLPGPICARLGGGGIADPDSAVAGGGGTTEQEASAVLGGGGIAEQEASEVRGGGGMADPDSAVLGGGGMAEQDSAVLGGGGMNDPERAGLNAPLGPYRPGEKEMSPSSSPRSSSAASPNSMPSWCADTGPASRPQRLQISSASSEVHTTTRVRSPRNRSRANSSGSPERA